MRRAPTLLALLLGLGLAPTGCDTSGDEPNLSLERMIDQPRYDPYEDADIFEDGSAMQKPPEGTVSRERFLGPPEISAGRTAGGEWVSRVPVPIDRNALEWGEERFRIYCAACHGTAGDGRSPVAENMTLRKPPSLVEPPVRAYPPGRVYRAIAEGYGMMPSYADVLAVEDRWAVVAYVGALQIAHEVELDALPPELREGARRHLEEER